MTARRKLPLDLQTEFFKFLNQESSVSELANWIYSTTALQTHMQPFDYQDLITIRFTSKHFKNELQKIVLPYLDDGLRETYRLKHIIQLLIAGKEGVAEALLQIYELEYSGYLFLDSLVMPYSLHLVMELQKYGRWDKIPAHRQTELLQPLLNGVKAEAKKIMNWLDTRQIVLTGKTDKAGFLTYIDNRTNTEKNSI